jgi:hypothetical protein
MGFNIKAVLGTVAPFLTAALPGPFSGIANKVIASALGLKPDAAPSDVQAAIDKGTLTGDQLVAIKAAEMEFQKTMAQLGYEDAEKLEALAGQDRDSARKREIAVRDWTPRLLAYGVTIGFFGVLAFMLTHVLEQSVKEPLLIMLGALQSAWVGVITYYFGSSSGSARKTELLSQAPTTDAAK